MPSSTAFTVMVPDSMTRPSLLVIPSLVFPMTVSAPVPVIVRSAVLNRAAFGSSVVASG